MFVRAYWANCFWLMVPVLAINLALGAALPAVFAPDAAALKVPGWLAILENALRWITVLLPLIMPLQIADRRGRVGLAIYGLGLALYALSWVPLVAMPQSAWSQSLPGLSAPAITPAIWLLGIALIGDRRYRLLKLPQGTFGTAAVLFLAAHITRTLFVVG